MAENAPTTFALFKRRRLIAPRFQLKYAVLFAAGNAAVAIAGAALLYATLREVYLRMPLAEPLREQLQWWNAAGLLTLAGIWLLTGAAFAYAILVVTHRVMGPVYVMSRYLTDLVEGRPPQMRELRTDDELSQFHDLLCRVIQMQSAREVEEAYRISQSVSALAPLANSEEAKGSLEALRQLAERKRQAGAPAQRSADPKAAALRAGQP